MSRRQNWVFTFTAEQVLAAAHKQHVHHLMRLQHWERELARAESSQGSGSGAVSEARARVGWHYEQVQSYAEWIGSLQTFYGDEELELDVDDVVFFGLGNPPDEPTQTSGSMPGVQAIDDVR